MGRKKKRCKKNRRRSLKKCIIVHHQDHQEQQSCCYIQIMALTRIYRKCCSILIGWIFGVISTSGALLLGLHSSIKHLLEVKIELMDYAVLAIGLLKRHPHFDLFWITSLIMPLIGMLKWLPPILGDDTWFVVPAAYATFILHQLLSIYVKYFHSKILTVKNVQ